MKSKEIIFDNHLHLRKNGRFLEAVKDFKKAGGTHFVLCQYPNIETVIKTRSYQPLYNETIKMAEHIRKNSDIVVFVTLGPYPIDYLQLKDVFGINQAVEIMRKGMDQAACLFQEQKCIAIGEIGRPHFPVDKETINQSNKLLFYGMQKARDVGSSIVLHSESTTPAQCKEFALMGKKAGLSEDKIVKHFSPPFIFFEENYGLMPSVLASKKNILNAIKKGTRFLMETDYIDDPKRPGAVLGPKTVPKRTYELLQKGLISEKEMFIIHKENPEKTYDINLE